MDRDENLYFDEFSKKSLIEIQEMFQNLKHIGMSDEEIDKYAKQYKEFFDSRNKIHNLHNSIKATGYKHIDGSDKKPVNTSIPWRKDLMKGDSEITESNETHQ